MGHKRLKLGQGFRGPEFFGCINSGSAPVIIKSKHLKRWSVYRYYVGPEFPIRFDLYEVLRLAMVGHGYKFHSGHWTFFLYQSPSAAWTRFDALCKAQNEINADVRAEAAELRVKAQKGDLGAALALSGY